MGVPQLPCEIITHLASFLQIKEAKTLAVTCRRFYYCALDRIWNYPSLKKPITVRLLKDEWRHFPIRHLNSTDLVEFQTGDFKSVVKELNELTSIKSLTLNHSKALDPEEIAVLLELNCNLYVFTPLVKQWNPDIIQQMKNKKYGMVTLHLETVCTQRWTLSQLRQLQGLQVNFIDSTSMALVDYNSYLQPNSQELLETLHALNAKNVHLIERGYCFIYLTRTDLLAMKKVNLRSITTSLLQDYFGPIHPWPELLLFPSLQVIRIEHSTYISSHLLQMFPISFIVVVWEDIRLALHGPLDDALDFMKKLGALTKKSLGIYRLHNAIYLYLRYLYDNDDHLIHIYAPFRYR